MWLIDADALLQKFKDGESDTEKEKELNQIARYIIRHTPKADAKEVVHATWVKRSFVSSDVFCSECRTLETTKDSNYKSQYCPHCGAKMDLTGDNA